MAGKKKTIDEYLAGLDGASQKVLLQLRKRILAAAPGAEECIHYGLAAFRLKGKMLVAMGATARHCAFYPLSGATVAEHAEALSGFETSKGTIRFQPDKPLPAALVRLLVKARIEENMQD